MMKKVGLLIIGLIALLIVLANVGPLISLSICAIILYFTFRQFIKSESKGAKIAWAIISIVMLMATISHFPAILALAAAYILYLVYKKWDKRDEGMVENVDPFMNFERQWKDLNKY